MTPAFTRSALNKGIQMSNYYVSGCKGQDDDIVTCDDSEAEFWTIYRRDSMGLSQGLVDFTFREDAEAAMKVYEEREALQEQLTATTNSLTNAQEALKSAGIEADTVQAGVMELVNRMNQVVAENALMLADYRDIPEMRRIGAPLTPATDAYLNAVRAEGVVMLSQLMKENGHHHHAAGARAFAAQLRAGNAGKNGSHE